MIPNKTNGNKDEHYIILARKS